MAKAKIWARAARRVHRRRSKAGCGSAREGEGVGGEEADVGMNIEEVDKTAGGDTAVAAVEVAVVAAVCGSSVNETAGV